MSRMCDKCIKRKTMWCPNSSECYNSQEVPHFMNNVMALQELERYKNIVDELERYIKDELILDFYNDDMPCELIVNKMENMIKELKGE